ncbi:MAG TPA: VOC family protein [Actinomycetota bacterium]|jgi:predicted enzyme related to lactoylglutathione lyase
MNAARISHVMLDARDPESLAPFWCGLLGTEVDYRFDEGRFVFLRSAGEAPAIGIQWVPEPKAGKNRMHVDLEVDDLEEWTRWVRRHGGSRIADRETAGVRWRVMADPEGNEFCLVPREA